MKPEQTSMPQAGLRSRNAKSAFLKWAGAGILVFSVFVVLAVWVGRHVAHAPGQEEEGSLGFFARSQQNNREVKKASSGLIDLAAVNASLRARGARTDGLAGAYVAAENEESAAYNRRVNDWSAQAAASAEKAQKSQEVYFGQDADIALRAAAAQGTAQGSADTAAMHAASNVSSLAVMQPKSAVAGRIPGVDIAALDRALQRYASGAKLSSAASVSSAQTTLNEAVEMGLAAQNSADLMRKKQLAAAGFMAAAVPQEKEAVTLADANVVLSGKETGNSYQQANRQLVDTQKCMQLKTQAKEKLMTQVSQIKQSIRAIRSGVPAACNQLSTWKNALVQVRTGCQNMRTQLITLRNTCGMILKKEGSCEAVYLEAYAADLAAVCENLATAEAENPRNMQKIAQLTREREELIQNFDVGQLNNTFNVDVDGIVGTNDFFPQTENAGW